VTAGGARARPASLWAPASHSWGHLPHLLPTRRRLALQGISAVVFCWALGVRYGPASVKGQPAVDGASCLSTTHCNSMPRLARRCASSLGGQRLLAQKGLAIRLSGLLGPSSATFRRILDSVGPLGARSSCVTDSGRDRGRAGWASSECVNQSRPLSRALSWARSRAWAPASLGTSRGRASRHDDSLRGIRSR
jgi:hypothetical protein